MPDPPLRRRRLDLDDLYRIPIPSDPQLSPDGHSVAYVVTIADRDDDAYRSTIWLVGSDGGEPRRLTNGPHDVAPRWSPDGTRLAFLAARADDAAQLHLLPLSGGEAGGLTSLPLGAGAAAWSPDGDRIAFTAIVDIADQRTDDRAPVVVDRLGFKADGAGLVGSRRAHLFVIDLDGPEGQPPDANQLTWGDWSVGGPAWSPDGERLAVAGAKGPDRDLHPTTAIFEIDADGGAARQISDGAGPLAAPRYTRAGDQLLCAGAHDLTPGHTRLLTVPTAGGDSVEIAPGFDRNVMLGAPGYPGASPCLVEGDRTVVFCARDHGCTHVYTTPLDPGGDQPAKVVGGADRTVSGMSAAPGAHRLAFVAASPSTAGEVFVVGLDGDGERQLTNLTSAALPDVELFVPEERSFATPDGTAVHGWILRDPAAMAPAPLLLDIHGGPHNAWGPSLDTGHLYHQTLAAQGWVIVYVNPRGSDGYGEEFYRAVVEAWGTSDDGDFLAAVDALVEEGLADPARLAVTGYSYGGFMTCWLTATTDRFAAAIAGGTVVDLAAEFGSADLGWYLGAYEVGATPSEDPERYRRHSPISAVGHVHTPTLLLHGGDDDRCPIGQAEAWFTALRARRIPCRLVRYPGASHVFIVLGKPSHRVDYARRLSDWATAHTTDSAAAALPLATRLAGYQGRFDALVRRFGLPGASLAVLADDEIVEYATGVLNVDTQQPVTTDSRFQIGSITKVFTATLVMQLVDQGLVALDAPVCEYVPTFRLAAAGAAEQITIRHLLTHSSGIPGDHFHDGGRGDDCVERYVESLADLTPARPPGAGFSYANSGYVLLGRVVEAVTGKPWHEALHERIAEPLGLSLRSRLDEIALGSFAVGHLPGDDPGAPPVVAPLFELDRSAAPAGSVTQATARDLVTFARMHLDDGRASDGREVLSAASLKAMQEHQIALPPALPLDAWGLGWALATWGDERVLWHNGGTLGQGSDLTVVPDDGLAVALLANGPGAPLLAKAVSRDLLGELAGLAPPAVLRPPAEAPTLDLTRYAGTYEHIGGRFEVRVEDEHLVVTAQELYSFAPDGKLPPASPPLPLSAVDATTFVSSAGAALAFLEPDDEGRPMWLFGGRMARRVTP